LRKILGREYLQPVVSANIESLAQPPFLSMQTFHDHSVRFAWVLLASLLIHLALIGGIPNLHWWLPITQTDVIPSLEVRFSPTLVKNESPPAPKQVNFHAQPTPPSQENPEMRVLTPSPILDNVVSIDPPAPPGQPEETQNNKLADSLETPPTPLPLEQDNNKITQHLPSSGKLIYTFYWGKSRWLAGQAIHQWVIENGLYTLSSNVSTTGLFGLFHPTKLVETSKGIIIGERLRPLQFSTQLNEQPPAVAIFNWDKGYFRWFRDKASFTQPLPANSYDKISYLYQLYIATEKGKFFSADITMERQLEHYEIQNLGIEEVEIDGTILPSIHLKRSTSSPEMEHVDIWLSTTNNNLPIKMTYSNNAGDHFEQLISLDSIPLK